MPRRKKQQKTQEIYTQVIPVASCSDEAQVRRIMHLCGIPRALTYNLPWIATRMGTQLEKSRSYRENPTEPN
ncbi:hypothetical protein [Coleofasciculus sp.]|uniref:hypothetical protein n=1 Tax=Coleofasciculus sp. TaxID=3100458 RepID=UPI003A44BF1B